MNRVLRKKRELSAGFSLVEVMVAVAILSFGIVSIFQTFFVLIDAFNRYTSFLDCQGWINEKLWEIEDELIRSGQPRLGRTSGRLKVNEKVFTWTVSVSPVDLKQGLLRVDASLKQKGKPQKMEIARSTYVLR